MTRAGSEATRDLDRSAGDVLDQLTAVGTRDEGLRMAQQAAREFGGADGLRLLSEAEVRSFADRASRQQAAPAVDR